MIPVSDAYKTAVNADQRYIVPKVLVYFDGDAAVPVEFDGDSIVSIAFLEESKADTDNPLGAVSSNEITISLDNSTRAFTSTNTSSPYYGKLRPKIKIKPYLRVRTEIDPAAWEEIPLGVFRTGDWAVPSTSLEATVTCYDRLYELAEKDIPMIPVKKDTTVKAMFEALFAALGLAPTDYDVDASLTQAIGKGWFDNNQVRDGLNALAVAGNCSVSMNRLDVVRVRPNVSTGAAVATMTDHNQIASGENPQKYLDTYSAVTIKYKIPYLKDSAVMLKIEEVAIPPGETVFEPLTFSSGPVMAIDYVLLQGANECEIKDIKNGAWTMGITIENTSEEDKTATLEVWGRVIDLVGAEYTATDPEASFDKTLNIENNLIQNEAAAASYAESLLDYVKDPNANFAFEVRGNPAIELIDVINIQNPSDKIDNVNVRPVRITLDFDGALSGTIEARKV